VRGGGDQSAVPGGVGEADFVAQLNRVIVDHPGPRFIVDSRDAAGLFRGAVLKINAREAARLVPLGHDPWDELAGGRLRRNALALAERNGQPVLVTRSGRGMERGMVEWPKLRGRIERHPISGRHPD